MKVDFESVNPPRPYTVSASVSVQDVNRQTWASSTSLLVHPADLYVGIKSARNFVQKGEKMAVESIVTGSRQQTRRQPRCRDKSRIEGLGVREGSWIEKTVDEQVCNVKSLGDKGQKCEFVAKAGGQYRISARDGRQGTLQRKRVHDLG
ncbi:MAG: hypothetical protein IPJ30_14325 [Acidobacteria bacterium]|nr:hypothetical protein [Acidobacteriota bacterium]